MNLIPKKSVQRVLSSLCAFLVMTQAPIAVLAYPDSKSESTKEAITQSETNAEKGMSESDDFSANAKKRRSATIQPFASREIFDSRTELFRRF